MALDNPSYFSVMVETNGPSKRSPRMGNIASVSDTVSTSSECSLGRQFTPPMSIANKRCIRNLLRSVSSTSADSNQELLIMGEPRMSDIAPELNFKIPNEPRRSNSLKTTRTDNRNLYMPLPTSEIEADELSGEDEEVFLSENSARYYNVTTKNGNSVTNRRRHSIGTVMARERSVSVTSSNASFKDDFPQVIIHATADGNTVGANAVPIDDHSMRHSSYPRKRCNRCTRAPAKKASEMDDILIVSMKNSEPAALWVHYFTSYFEQFNSQPSRRSLKVHHLFIEDVIDANGEIRFILEKTAAVKLQLIVICPLFLNQIAKNLNKVSSLSKLLHPNKILALLLGVTDSDILDIHKNVLTTYSQWQRHIVDGDQDETFAKEFLGAAMTIFTRVWKQQSSISAQEKSHFSVSPKKVRQGQNSVLIILTYPLQREDTVKISIEKDNAIIEVKTVKRKNPYTLKISIPESLTEVSAIVNVLVEKNGSIIGSRPIKCESRLRELEQILRSTTNPVEFMCQTLGFSPQDKVQLDNWMVHTFQKNLPPNFNVLANYSIHPADKLKPRCEEFPTLLHFAAKYGFEKMAMQLVDCPGGDAASEIRNSNDCLPADIAEIEGFTELAQMLRGYMKMNEFTKMYAKLKEISLNPDSINNVDEDYLTPKDVNDFYKPCPPPKPVLSPITIPSVEVPQEGGYMTMNNVAAQRRTPPETVQRDRSLPRNKMKPASSNSNISTTSQSREPTKPSPVCEDKVQTELMEIINDFKNNVHSIAQAEKLVDSWKNRNDVQKSFREKTDQLNEMRKKYEKIQNEMKSSNSKITLFDRVTKLFAWGKHKEIKTVEKDTSIIPVNTRPISSLSIQSTSSSGSSGRMSTISGCSLGDSGTHSDHEDRKNLLTNSSDDDFRSIMRDMKEGNYMVPPAPKPVSSSFLNNRTVFPPIEEVLLQERPPQPIPKLEDEYYIKFPPSGLPVQNISTDSEPSENNVYIEFDSQNTQNQLSSPTIEYMNIIPMSEDLDCHEYMNFSPPVNIPKK